MPAVLGLPARAAPTSTTRGSGTGWCDALESHVATPCRAGRRAAHAEGGLLGGREERPPRSNLATALLLPRLEADDVSHLHTLTALDDLAGGDLRPDLHDLHGADPL